METLKPTPALFSLLLLTLAVAVAATANASARKTGPPAPVSFDGAAAPSTSSSDAADDTAASASAAATVAAPSTSASSDVADDAATSASAASADDQPPVFTFFMHDVLGGTNPSARIVSGIVDNAAVSGQLPFARPNGAVLPLNGGVSVSGNGNGAVDNNNIPFLTGLGGTTSAVTQTNGNGNGVGNGLPFFAGGSLPEGTSLQRLLFGTLTVMDDELTEGPELGSGVVGKAQGFYVASSEQGAGQTVALTAMLTAGEYADSVSLFGVHRAAESESYLAVVGGTGKYAGARGFAKAAVVRTPAAAHETDGVESVLQVTVHLSGY